ncbi:MAG TPA: ribonuclease HII [Tenuifilaceae bacterium]|nr:ribonuclease HII [Tenuifilaceae bacterium]HPE17583.1 ribonuclease HII [Tenuifilaceae bacterium]HPJ45955.1 ribonuclease HII [Tenuifilaceae bacterium]HPQ34299.1 ribonuclease HII [Tenuifilaceae bacterium]HRX67967.1 ribonuclease HII [Tenuifilaceae bacterium]
MEASLKPCLNPGLLEAGCDEAGRGCLAGPVFAAAVILPEKFFHPKLNDSKKISEKQREELRVVIEREAIAYCVQQCSPQEIDQINILNASILAMHRAISGLEVKPDFLLIDGNRFKPYPGTPHRCIVKGDSKFAAIAAASILAKTYRDDFMLELSEKYPPYLWHKNKGYPTQEHRKAIEKHGVSPHHRNSFKLTERQLKLNL